MKRNIFLLLFCVLSSTNLLAEDHGDSVPAQRPTITPEQALNQLNNMISTCMAGRPVSEIPPFGPTPNITLPPNPAPIVGDTTPPATPPQIPGGGDATRGATIYNTTCTSCHNSNKQAPALSSIPAAQKIAAVSGPNPSMPKGSKLSEQEKLDLIAHLNTLK